MYRDSFTDKWLSVILLSFECHSDPFGNLSEFDVTYGEKSRIGSQDFIFDDLNFLGKNHGILLTRINAFQTRDFNKWR